MCMWGVSSTSFKVTMDMQALYRHWIGEFYEVEDQRYLKLHMGKPQSGLCN